MILTFAGQQPSWIPKVAGVGLPSVCWLSALSAERYCCEGCEIGHSWVESAKRQLVLCLAYLLQLGEALDLATYMYVIVSYKIDC